MNLDEIEKLNARERAALADALELELLRPALMRSSATRETLFIPVLRNKKQRSDAGGGILTHGTISAYTTYKCRCDECRRAKREYERKRAIKARQATITPIRDFETG